MSKKYISQLAAIAAAAAMSQGAFAAANDTGNINFEGEITASICSISPKSHNMTVFLGKPTVNKFKAAGDRAATADFTIDLLDCPPVGEKANVAKVTFDGVPDVSAASASKWLKVGAGSVTNQTAQGVAVRIADSSDTQIDLRSPSADYTLNEGTNSLKFKASYIATQAKVTAGAANATATFRVDYN